MHQTVDTGQRVLEATGEDDTQGTPCPSRAALPPGGRMLLHTKAIAEGRRQ